MVGRERLVLDLSCRRRDGRLWVVTDRWQRFSSLAVTPQLLQVPPLPPPPHHHYIPCKLASISHGLAMGRASCSSALRRLTAWQVLLIAVCGLEVFAQLPKCLGIERAQLRMQRPAWQVM